LLPGEWCPRTESVVIPEIKNPLLFLARGKFDF
jgi:hypothetical protein